MSASLAARAGETTQRVDNVAAEVVPIRDIHLFGDIFRCGQPGFRLFTGFTKSMRHSINAPTNFFKHFVVSGIGGMLYL